MKYTWVWILLALSAVGTFFVIVLLPLITNANAANNNSAANLVAAQNSANNSLGGMLNNVSSTTGSLDNLFGSDS